MKIYCLICLFLCLSIQSCDNKLELNAPYKETAVVYGLLNSNDDIQYIKVGRTFLGEGNVYDFAKIKDSLYFKYPIKVNIIGRSANDIVQNISCHTVEVPKDSGIFNSAPYLLYATPKVKLDSSLNYSLEVRKAANDSLICSSNTNVVGSFYFINPPLSCALYKTGKYNRFFLRWVTARNGIRYDVKLVFKYTESGSNGFSQIKEVHIPMLTNLQGVGEAGTEQRVFLDGSQFYNAILGQVKPNPNVTRYIDKFVRVEFSVAALDLDKYLTVNGPVISLSDVKPEYTNIVNGLGLFSSRYFNTYTGILDEASLEWLKSGEVTGNLGFVN